MQWIETRQHRTQERRLQSWEGWLYPFPSLSSSYPLHLLFLVTVLWIPSLHRHSLHLLSSKTYYLEPPLFAVVFPCSATWSNSYPLSLISPHTFHGILSFCHFEHCPLEQFLSSQPYTTFAFAGLASCNLGNACLLLHMDFSWPRLLMFSLYSTGTKQCTTAALPLFSCGCWWCRHEPGCGSGRHAGYCSWLGFDGPEGSEGCWWWPPHVAGGEKLQRSVQWCWWRRQCVKPPLASTSHSLPCGLTRWSTGHVCVPLMHAVSGWDQDGASRTLPSSCLHDVVGRTPSIDWLMQEWYLFSLFTTFEPGRNLRSWSRTLVSCSKKMSHWCWEREREREEDWLSVKELCLCIISWCFLYWIPFHMQSPNPSFLPRVKSLKKACYAYPRHL